MVVVQEPVVDAEPEEPQMEQDDAATPDGEAESTERVNTATTHLMPTDYMPVESCLDWKQYLDQPLSVTCEKLSISETVFENLQAMNIESFFPVQARIVPLLMRYSGCSIQPMDLCVSAPTGSGKTLAYMIPIVHALLPTRVHRLRALVILPTRELAMQVHGICSKLCTSTHLKVALAVGQGEFAEEAAQITGRESHESHINLLPSRYATFSVLV